MVREPETLVKNVGPVDRVVRVGLGLVLIGLGALTGWGPWARSAAAALGGLQVFVGLTGY